MSVPDLSRPLGRYKLVRMLGEGNMGKVYRAIDSRLEREIALKIPTFGPNDENAIKRFQREAHAAAVVNHPNICPVYDVEEIDGKHFLTMPLIEGEPLSNMVGPGKLWDIRKAVELIRTLALAMDEMHKKGLMHRDLKPANVMVRSRDKVPIIMDMGLARSYLDDIAMVTVQGQKIGTPAYMSPEQVRGDVHMTHSCDIYSLGIILYQLLTGKVPFVGKPGSIYHHILNTPPDPPSTLRPEIPKQLDIIVLRTLQKKAEDRFGTMAEFAQYLEQFLQIGQKEAGGAAGAGGGGGQKLEQTLELLRQRTDELQRMQTQFNALAQAAKQEREIRFDLEQKLRDNVHQVQAAQSELEMTRRMWGTAERKYLEQINELKAQAGSGGVAPAELLRQVEELKRQVTGKDSELSMFKNMWQASERKNEFEKEELNRQLQEARQELVLRRGQAVEPALKQKYEALERKLQTLEKQHEGQMEQLQVAAEQVRNERDLERQAKQALEERLAALQSESVMIKRLWEHRERQLVEDLTRAQEDVARLSKQVAGVNPQKLREAELQVIKLQEQLQQEKQQRHTQEEQRQQLEERLAQLEARLQGSVNEAETLKRKWAATEKNYQEQMAKLQEDLRHAQALPAADKERFQQLAQQMEEQTQELLQTKAALDHTEETTNLLRAEHTALLEKFALKVKELQAAKEATAAEQKQREELERARGDLQAAIQNARAHSEASEKAVAEEQAQRQRREERLKELEEQLGQLQADQESWRQKLDAARATEDELRQKLQAATEAGAQVKDLQQRLRNLEARLAQEQEFRHQAEAQVIELASASTDAELQASRVSTLEDQLAVEQKRRAEREAQLAQEQQLRSALEEEAATLRRELEALRDAPAPPPAVAEPDPAILEEKRHLQEQLELVQHQLQAERERGEQLYKDLLAEQESVDSLVREERARYRELEDELAQVRQQLAANPAPPVATAPPVVQPSPEQEARIQSLEEQLQQLAEQRAETERRLQEAQAKEREWREKLEAALAAPAANGQADQLHASLQALRQEMEQERDQRQEAEDRVREAIAVAADLRRRLEATEKTLAEKSQAAADPRLPELEKRLQEALDKQRAAERALEDERLRLGRSMDTRVQELERRLSEMQEKTLSAEYARKDAELKLSFLERRMQTVDEMAADDCKRRVEAERRQREAEVSLEEERRLRQAMEKRNWEITQRMQEAQLQLSTVAQTATTEKHSRVLAEQELAKLRAMLESQQAAPPPVPSGPPTPRSGATKRPPLQDNMRPPRRTAPPPPVVPESTDDGPTVEMKAFSQSDRPTPASGMINAPRGAATSRPTPDAGYPRVQVELRGSWYCRPADDATAKWSKVAETPALVQIKPGESCFLKVANVVTDAELVLLNSLRQVPSLHTLSLSGCPEVTDQGLIHLRTLGQLQALNLASTPGISDAGLSHLRSLTRLTILSLNSCAGITDIGLTHVGMLTNLQTLYLDNCTQITDQGIQHLSKLTNLQALILTGCTQISDAALEVIGNMTNLHTLNLDRCPRLTDRGLASLHDLINLNNLSLDRCDQITDAGLLHLRGLENLQTLSVTYCPRITQAGQKHLAHLTKLQIITNQAAGQRPARV
jgi:hypothetical protein